MLITFKEVYFLSQISNTAFDTLIEYIKKNKKIDEELKRFLVFKGLINN